MVVPPLLLLQRLGGQQLSLQSQYQCASLGDHRLLGEACPPAGPSRGSRRAALPQVAGDGEGVHTHAHGFGWDAAKLLPVRAVLVDGLHLRGADCPRADPGQTHQLLGLGVHGVDAPELAAGVTEEDEEVIGWALLHLLELPVARRRKEEKEEKW